MLGIYVQKACITVSIDPHDHIVSILQRILAGALAHRFDRLYVMCGNIGARLILHQEKNLMDFTLIYVFDDHSLCLDTLNDLNQKDRSKSRRTTT